MKRPRTIALSITISAFLVLVVAWIALNHFRAEFYNSAMEGLSADSSPYWTIIRIQDILKWPIFSLAALSGLLILVELVSRISALFRGESGKL